MGNGVKSVFLYCVMLDITYILTYNRGKSTYSIMAITEISIPSHWDTKTLNQMANMPAGEGVRLSEVYGVMAHGGPVGHGRSSNAVKEVTEAEAVAYREAVKSKGLLFTYLLNAPYSRDQKQQAELEGYLEWIFSDIKPDAVTVTSLDLMREVRRMDSTVGIHISTIAGVKTPKDLEPFLEVGPNRVVPHHDLGKDHKNLEAIVKISDREGIEVELLATESCLYRCQDRCAHYESLAKRGAQDAPFHSTCNTRKLTKPRELLMAGGTIRPEDVAKYESMGVKYIKLSGRSKPSMWLPEVVQAYLRRSYDGNLIRLLGIDPSIRAEDWIFINNKALDGFIDGYPVNQPYPAQAEYCDGWISKMHTSGDFAVSDGTVYTNDDRRLVLKQAGVNAERIILKERK